MILRSYCTHRDDAIAATSSIRFRYEKYISSDAWRRSPARLLELQRSGARCRICGAGGPEARVEVHHRNYENLGREDVADLCALCSECHRVVTAELRRRRYAAMPMPALTDTPRILADRVLAFVGA